MNVGNIFSLFVCFQRGRKFNKDENDTYCSRLAQHNTLACLAQKKFVLHFREAS